MNVGSIFLFHPSRGRPQMGANSASELMAKRRLDLPFRYLFSLDTDDPALDQYRSAIAQLPFPADLIVNPNPSVVPAVNAAAAKVGSEDLMINIADDFGYGEGWDAKLVDYIAKIPSPEYLIHVTNMDNGAAIPVIQIVSTALYRRLGYFFYPEYISMYADQDLLECCRAGGWVYSYDGPDLQFVHKHPNWGKGQWDATYERENQIQFHHHGLAVLAARRSKNFDL